MNELLRRIATGDESAFTEFTKRYRRKISAYFRGHLGNCYHTGEDLAQDAMIRILKSAHLWNPKLGEAVAWVSTVCKHILIDHCRKQRRRHAIVNAAPIYNAFTGLTRQIASDEIGPLCRAEAKDTLEEIRKHLPELNAEQADVLRRFCDGESLPQIAAELDLCLPTVRSRLRLGKERLQRLTRSIAK